MDKQIKYILTDIEGTTSSVHFVYEVLFPYFREHLNDLTKHAQVNEVKQAFAEVIEITLQEEGKHLTTTEEVLACLEKWSREDRKLTPLKTLQGVIWKNGYETGAITGHVYEDVTNQLQLLHERAEWFAGPLFGQLRAQRQYRIKTKFDRLQDPKIG